jgi:uncharacterized lipoprotein NlpE involved in copper resistance
MKKTVFSLIIFTFLFLPSCKNENKNEGFFNNQKEIVNEEQGMDGQTSINSLDWEGIYEGTIPCSDCDGIFTELTINNDDTFVMHSTKIKGDKKEKSIQQGLYQWDESGSKITLDLTERKALFKVEENRLILLYEGGNKMPESGTTNYALLKKN